MTGSGHWLMEEAPEQVIPVLAPTLPAVIADAQPTRTRRGPGLAT